MIDIISESFAVIITVIVFTAIYILKYQCSKGKYVTCQKCGGNFSWDWYLGCHGYCPDCKEELQHQPKEN